MIAPTPPRTVALVFLALAALPGGAVGCSSNAGAPESTTDAPGPGDDAAVDDGNESRADTATGEPADEGVDVKAATDGAAEAPDPMHQCPGCQATKCGDELKACGSASGCVDWLLCMNECFKKPDVAACQTGCRKSMVPAAKKMDDCTAAKCHDECTP